MFDLNNHRRKINGVIMSKKEYKPLGYEKFVIMAIFEKGLISLNDLEDITIVFISSI